MQAGEIQVLRGKDKAPWVALPRRARARGGGDGRLLDWSAAVGNRAAGAIARQLAEGAKRPIPVRRLRVPRAALQRVRYADAPAAVDNLIRDSKVRDAADSYNEAYEYGDEEEMAQEYEALRKLLPDLARPEGLFTPELLPPSARNEEFEAGFADVTRISGLPPPFERDEIKLNLGRSVAHLLNHLEDAGVEPSGAGFTQYVDRNLSAFEAVKARFRDEPEVLETFWREQMKETSIVFEPLSADPHGFDPPAALTFTARGKNGDAPGASTKLVYKARPGAVDVLVTQLFERINDLTGKERPLPEYKQAVFRDGTLLSEFIEGQRLDSVVEVYKGAAHPESLARLPGVDDPDKLKKRLELLQLVAKKIGLTDLHEENLIWNAVTQQVVPIDLEAFDERRATGLYGMYGEEPTLTWNAFSEQVRAMSQEIEALIAKFNEDKAAVARRLVPVPTAALHRALEGGVAVAVDRIADALEKEHGFTVIREALGEYVTACKNRKPVTIPLFTIQGRNVMSSRIGDLDQQVVASAKG